MPIVSLVLELHLPDATTTRLRREHAEAILGKLRRHFNVSASDLSREAASGPLALGFAAVGRTRREAREILDRVADAVAAHPHAQVLRAAFDDL